MITDFADADLQEHSRKWVPNRLVALQGTALPSAAAADSGEAACWRSWLEALHMTAAVYY